MVDYTRRVYLEASLPREGVRAGSKLERGTGVLVTIFIMNTFICFGGGH